MKAWNRVKALTRIVFRRESWRMWLQPRSRFDFQREVGDGTGSSTVMAPLLWIARTFPEAPIALWRLLDDGGEEREMGHDLIRLLERPNKFYSGAAFWMATMLDWNVDGNAYWIKVRRNTGAVEELWWTPHFLLEPKGDENNFITHYLYRPDGQEIRLDPEDVVHFRFGIDNDNQRLGFSPLKSVLREVFTDNEAATFTAGLLRNMGVPGLIVSPAPGEPSPGEDDVKATKAYFKTAFAGDRAGEPLVMGGATRVAQFGFSPEQMNLKALRRIPEERISAVLGVPAIVAGLGAGLDRSTFANMSEAREMAFESNIVPAQRILAEEVRFQLLSDFEEDPWAWRVGFDLSGVRVLQEDRNRLAERLDVGVRGGWVRVAEARRELGLEATDRDEIYLRGLNLLEIGADGSRPMPLPEETMNGNGARSRLAGMKQGAQTAQTSRLVQAMDRLGRTLEVALAEELEADFAGLGERAASAYREAQREQLAGLGEPATKAEHKQEDNAALVARILGSLALGDWVDKHLRARFEIHYGRTARETIGILNSVLDLGVELPDEVERSLIARGGMRRGLVDVERQARDSLFRILAAGREAGLGPLEIARQIRAELPAGRFVNAGPAYRARMVARTETKFAQNISSMEAYRQAENVVSVVAYDARLGETDDECEARDGQIFSIEDAESELASEHPNGTLSFAPLVRGEETI